MNILIFTLLFNALEAISDALRDNGNKLLAGVIEFILKAGTVLICLLWFKGVFYFDSDKGFWSLVISFTLVRYFLFDWIYNIFRGLDMFYIGNTKLYDKILSKLGFLPVLITKIIAGFIGIIFLI